MHTWVQMDKLTDHNGEKAVGGAEAVCIIFRCRVRNTFVQYYRSGAQWEKKVKVYIYSNRCWIHAQHT